MLFTISAPKLLGRGQENTLHHLLREQFIAAAQHERQAKKAFVISIVENAERRLITAPNRCRQSARRVVGARHKLGTGSFHSRDAVSAPG